MPNPDILFLSWVNERVPADLEVRGCWSLVQRGAELGWLDGSEVRELLEHLRARKDFGVEELLFAHVGDRLRVSFLDEIIECSPAAMVKELAALVARTEHSVA